MQIYKSGRPAASETRRSWGFRGSEPGNWGTNEDAEGPGGSGAPLGEVQGVSNRKKPFKHTIRGPRELNQELKVPSETTAQHAARQTAVTSESRGPRGHGELLARADPHRWSSWDPKRGSWESSCSQRGADVSEPPGSRGPRWWFSGLLHRFRSRTADFLSASAR